MNISRLFEQQKELDAHIESEHPRQPGEDRALKKITALQVEIGELANEVRYFKFWSQDQKPRTKIEHMCPACNMTGTIIGDSSPYVCYECGGTGKLEESNPLLEEYVDGIHFYLSIGNETGLKPEIGYWEVSGSPDINVIFAKLNKRVADMWWNHHDGQAGKFETNFLFGLKEFIWLGKMLRFTWEEVEQAYDAKNATNHERQQSGY